MSAASESLRNRSTCNRYGMYTSWKLCRHESSSATSARIRSNAAKRSATKHSREPMSLKYRNRSSATSVLFETAAVVIASLNSLSSFDSAIDRSHLLFFVYKCAATARAQESQLP